MDKRAGAVGDVLASVGARSANTVAKVLSIFGKNNKSVELLNALNEYNLGMAVGYPVNPAHSKRFAEARALLRNLGIGVSAAGATGAAATTAAGVGAYKLAPELSKLYDMHRVDGLSKQAFDIGAALTGAIPVVGPLAAAVTSDRENEERALLSSAGGQVMGALGGAAGAKARNALRTSAKPLSVKLSALLGAVLLGGLFTGNSVMSPREVHLLRTARARSRGTDYPDAY